MGKYRPPKFVATPQTLSAVIRAGMTETDFDQSARFIRNLNSACLACSMCELGRQDAHHDHTKRDPHVLSNLNPKRFVLVTQNPGWPELEKRQPLAGPSGAVLDKYLRLHGLDRSYFYITHLVKCWTGDKSPTEESIKTCRQFLDMEMTTVKPKMMVALGRAAYDILCPGGDFTNDVTKLHPCPRYNTKVFAMFHPQEADLCDVTLKKEFEKQIAILCGMVAKLTSTAT